MTFFLATQVGPPARAADVPSDWAQAEIDAARAKGLILTPADRNYQANISRVLFCMQIINMVETTLGAPVTLTVTNPFGDISSAYVTKAYQLGIVTGRSPTVFDPNAYITRQEIAAMMMRSARALDLLGGKAYAAVAGTESIVFADQADIDGWALDDVRAANGLDLMRGVGDNRINPKGNTTVQESILLVNRLFDGFVAAPASGTGTGGSTVPAARGNPVAFSVTEQTARVIEADQLASDLDGDALTVVAVNGQTLPHTTLFGTAELTADGKVSYTSADIDTDSQDDFVVTVSDGTNLVHVNIRVNISRSLTIVFNPSVASVTVFGDPVVNGTVSAGLISYIGGIPSPAPTLSYQWMSAMTAGGNYINILGATAPSYVIGEGSAGKYLKLKVTAAGSAGGTATSAAIGPVTSGFAAGSGTSVSPYEIATAQQMLRLNTFTTSGRYFKLTADITLPDNSYITSRFDGTLYGYAHTVTVNLTSGTGLFAQTGSTAVVNSVVVDGNIFTADSYVGGISGRNDGTIVSCISAVTIQAHDNVGGITGYNTGTVNRCSSSAAVYGGSYAGGIAGSNNGIVARCGATDEGIVVGHDTAGGAVGRNMTNGSIANSYARLNVSVNTSYAGGLAGTNAGTVINCYSIGCPSGASNLGGLVGANSGGTVAASYYNTDTSYMSDTGKGEPKLTGQMMSRFTYSGWDFTTIWGLTDGQPQYPWLR
jgi:hypothetical protein